MASTSSEQEGTARRRARGALIAFLAAAGVVLLVVGGLALIDSDDEPAALVKPSKPGSHRTVKEPVTSLDESPPVADPAAGAPRVLTVPHLGITAEVRRIEVEGGVLTPPSDAAEVGWDITTAQAGAAYGSTIITGHTVHTGGGALDELDDLRIGDEVMVATSRGRIEYDVTDVVELTKQQMVRAIPKLYRREVPGRIVLITCTDWNGFEYLANTVVVAEPARA
ncbi:MAG TPA: class F sortase [Nocardioidaceae bacterium]|nr:class F sortase [Nocardioidaceae bacterium]